MSEQREVVILSGVRTAIGDYGGSLKDIAPSDLAARVVKEAVSRAKIDPKDVGQCVFGNVIHTEPKDMYISRLACVNGGLPHDTGALTVNRLCGSGMQAIVSAAQYILLGETDAAVAGGAESMSRAAYASLTQRWGARMGDAEDDGHDGRRADRPVRHRAHGRHRRERREQVRHHARAAGRVRRREPQARGGGDRRRPLQEPDPADRAQEQEGPGDVRHRRARPRRRRRWKAWRSCRAVFIKENGTVTAGNASGINDAAAAVVLMEKSAAAKKGLKPMARLVAYGHAGIDPKIMGLGPVSAVQARAGQGRASSSTRWT